MSVNLSSLALSHSSRGPNGFVGVDWSVSGFSSITRCERTFAQDGEVVAIEYSADDHFCLDGQRLVAISRTYGANGTVYRTEIDSFARIISYAAGSGPQSFTVETKAGRKITYGGTADSRIEAPGHSEVRVWAASKIEDTATT